MRSEIRILICIFRQRSFFQRPARSALRNVAIIAHVDHGKTTLVGLRSWPDQRGTGALPSMQKWQTSGFDYRRLTHMQMHCSLGRAALQLPELAALRSTVWSSRAGWISKWQIVLWTQTSSRWREGSPSCPSKFLRTHARRAAGWWERYASLHSRTAFEGEMAWSILFQR